MQHNAMLGAPNDAAVRQRKALYALSDEQSAAIDRLCFALERQSGKADIRGILNRDERAPAGVAEHRLAGDALDLGSRFQFELAAHVVAGRQKERRAGLCGLISGVLQRCGLVAGPRHDAIGAERLRDIPLCSHRAEAGRQRETHAERSEHQLPAPDRHLLRVLVEQVCRFRGKPDSCSLLWDSGVSVSEDKAKKLLGTFQQFGLGERTTLGGGMWNVHEQSERRSLLARAPIERKVVEVVAEVAPSGARCCCSETLRSEMSGKHCGGQPRIVALWTLRENEGTRGESSPRVGTRRGAVLCRPLDAKGFRALAHPEMNDDLRLQGFVQGRRERGNGLPFGGEYLRMNIAIVDRRGGCQSLNKAGRRIVRNAGKRAKAREKHAQPCHAFRITRLLGFREANSRDGYRASLMPARRPSSCAAAAGVISPERTLSSSSFQCRAARFPPLKAASRRCSKISRIQAAAWSLRR